jgi:hypothetical protein
MCRHTTQQDDAGEYRATQEGPGILAHNQAYFRPLRHGKRIVVVLGTDVHPFGDQT